jgi:hypothetical protein
LLNYGVKQIEYFCCVFLLNNTCLAKSQFNVDLFMRPAILWRTAVLFSFVHGFTPTLPKAIASLMLRQQRYQAGLSLKSNSLRPYKAAALRAQRYARLLAGDFP